MSVYIIVKKNTVCHGHGDYGEVFSIAMINPYDNPPPHPAFRSKEAAKAYLATLSYAGLLSVLEIQMGEP